MIPEAKSDRARVLLPDQQYYCKMDDAIQAQKSIHKRTPPKKEQVDNNNDDETTRTVTTGARKRKMMNMVAGEGPGMERLRLLGTNCCCSSSGSDHGPTSITLSALVHQFIEHDSSNNCNDKCTDVSSSGRIGRSSSINNNAATTATPTVLDLHNILLSDFESIKPWEDLIRSILNDPHLRLTCCKDVSSCLKRSVMQRLRLSGHNAGVCKSRWGHSNNFPAGDYEFLDVITKSASGDGGQHQQQQLRRRLIIDVDFRSHFEIARPTNSYASLLQTIPAVYVGFAEKLCLVTDLMCDAAKLSLKKKGLHLPPWRKSGYLKAKWLSAYKRTTNSHCNHRRLPDDIHLCIPVEPAIASSEVQGSSAMARDTTSLPWGSGERCYGNQVMNHGEQLWPLPADESNGWQLPAVNSRPAKRRPTQVAGLAAVFIQSGMAVLNDTPETTFKERVAVQAI